MSVESLKFQLEYEISAESKLPDDHPVRAIILIKIGDIYHKLSDYKSALAYYDKASNVFKRIPEIKSFDFDGETHDFNDALNYIESYKKQFFDISFQMDKATTKETNSLELIDELNSSVDNLFLDEQQSSNLVKKEESPSQLMPNSTKESASIACVLNKLSSEFFDIGQYDKASQLAAESLRINKSLHSEVVMEHFYHLYKLTVIKSNNKLDKNNNKNV
jgi:tetratricopeptide (TPR) repeat protein